MNNLDCEKALMAILAELDGEATDSSTEQAAAHLAACEACQQELKLMQNTVNLLKKQKIRKMNANLWTAIEERIDAKPRPAPEMKWQFFLLLGILLVGYKLLEMLPETDFGFFFKFTPLVIVGILFTLLKENPFKIKTEFTLEGEKL